MRVNLWKPEPKRRAGIVRTPVVPGLCLSKYTNTELGVRIARRANHPRQEPGIAWARLMHSANRPEKDMAREAVLRLLTPDHFPVLKILTFPASEWRFERDLLAMRGEPTDRGPHRTDINAIERDIAVYRAACHSIPRSRSKKRKREAVRTPTCPAFATACVQTAQVGAFYCCTFEDFAKDSANYGVFHAAWLDFNGKLTASRLSAIARFWERQVGSLLVVTLYNARTDEGINRLIHGAGGIEHLLALRLPGSVVEDVTHYNDAAPMVQIVLRRAYGSPSLSLSRSDMERVS
jgi:hypothetical protein